MDTHDHGPNGVLVRDALLDPKGVWLVRIPEIVEDICFAARNALGVDLESRFDRATTPCVVEFATCARNPHNALTAACCYAEVGLRGKTAGGDALCNFDGDGVAVPPGDVVLVEVAVQLR